MRRDTVRIAVADQLSKLEAMSYGHESAACGRRQGEIRE